MSARGMLGIFTLRNDPIYSFTWFVPSICLLRRPLNGRQLRSLDETPQWTFEPGRGRVSFSAIILSLHIADDKDNATTVSKASKDAMWTHFISYVKNQNLQSGWWLSHITTKRDSQCKELTMVSFGRILSAGLFLPCHPRERGEIWRNVVHHLLLCIQTPSTSSTAGQ